MVWSCLRQLRCLLDTEQDIRARNTTERLTHLNSTASSHLKRGIVSRRPCYAIKILAEARIVVAKTQEQYRIASFPPGVRVTPGLESHKRPVWAIREKRAWNLAGMKQEILCTHQYCGKLSRSLSHHLCCSDSRSRVLGFLPSFSTVCGVDFLDICGRRPFARSDTPTAFFTSVMDVWAETCPDLRRVWCMMAVDRTC